MRAIGRVGRLGAAGGRAPAGAARRAAATTGGQPDVTEISISSPQNETRPCTGADSGKGAS
jgi:hypothetical protein